MNQEKEHGVTFHVMQIGNNRGDILLQEHVELNDMDRTLTLNLKCWEKAVVMFERLLQLLSSTEGELKHMAKKQTNINKSYYGKYVRPKNCCLIDWNNTSEQIFALYRGLDFGPLEMNPFGLPKAILENQLLIINKCSILQNNSVEKYEAGLIVGASDSSITVVTGNEINFNITEMCTINGTPVKLSSEMKGKSFTNFDNDMYTKITNYNSVICKKEQAWINYFNKLKEHEAFNLKNLNFEDVPTDIKIINLSCDTLMETILSSYVLLLADSWI